jgi:transposase
VDNIVVDSASIEVNRRARRPKNDRLDADKLLAMLQRYCAGGRRVWSVLRTPTVQEEDARRVDRELQRLTGERTAHINRIGSLLVLHNLRAGRIGGRDWAAWWKSHAEQVPPALRAEIEREVERLALVKEQMSAIEARQRQEVANNTHPLVSRLSQLRAIGLDSAWKLDKELFGWRRFANRRQPGTDTHALRQRQQPDRAGHQQGGQQAAAILAGGVGVELAALPAQQRAQPVVRAPRRGCRQAHAPRRHRGPGQAAGHRTVAIPAARRDPARSNAQAGRGLSTIASRSK